MNAKRFEMVCLRKKVVAMYPNRKIKIIKSAQRGNNESVVKQEQAERRTGATDSNRAIAGRVSTWVREFQQRRIVDPRRAFASLFVAPGT